MRAYGLHVQPYLIVVGPEPSEVDTTYIVTEETIYQCDSFLAGLESLFEMYLAAKIPYPRESDTIYYFIQLHFFIIILAGETKNSCAINLNNKLKVGTKKANVPLRV